MEASRPASRRPQTKQANQQSASGGGVGDRTESRFRAVYGGRRRLDVEPQIPIGAFGGKGAPAEALHRESGEE